MTKNYILAFTAAIFGAFSIKAQTSQISVVPSHLTQPAEVSYQRAAGGGTNCTYAQPGSAFINGYQSYMNASNVPQNYIADDIFIPANETWEISEFYSHFFSNTTIVANSIYIFADNGSLAPSNTILQQFIALTPTSSVSIGQNYGYDIFRVKLDLANPIVLTGGTTGTRYWISSVARNQASAICFWETNNIAELFGTPTYSGNNANPISWSSNGSYGDAEAAVYELTYVKTSAVNYAICPGDSILIDGNYYSSNTVVNQTLSGVSCDSIVRHNVFVKPYCVDSCNYFQANDPANMFANGYQSNMNSAGIYQAMVADDINVPANEKWAINGIYSFYFAAHNTPIVENKIYFFNDSVQMPSFAPIDSIVGLTPSMSDSMGTRYGYTIYAVYTPFNQPYIIDGGTTGKTLWISNVARNQNGSICYWETGFNMINGTPTYSKPSNGASWTNYNGGDDQRAILELDYDIVIEFAPLASDTVCNTVPAFALPAASPVGGVYSGAGVSGNNFNPATAGAGTHTISYTFTKASTGCSYTESFDIVVENCLGVSEAGKAENVKVYPNPFNESLNISNAQQIANVEIRDLTGRVVYASAYNNTNQIQINTAEFVSGVYFVRMITTNNVVIDQKLVK